MDNVVTLQSRTVIGHADGPHLLIIGGVHGDEFEPMATCRQLLSTIRPEELKGRLTVIPTVNEPAFARCMRTGEDGLDLARVCPGDDAGSPTRRIAASLSRAIRSADALIDLHTAGARYEILRLAGYSLHSDAAVRAKQKAMAEAFGLPIVWGTSPRFNGTSLSVARDALKPAIYVENGGGSKCDPQRVQQNVWGCRQVLRVWGMLDEPVEPSSILYHVEDDRDHAGHLQRQHPAPMSGYFESSVAIGDVVTTGQRIGFVTDPLGDQRQDVFAAETGMALFLRTFPSVQKGDCLLSLLPITAPGKVTFERI